MAVWRPLAVFAAGLGRVHLAGKVAGAPAYGIDSSPSQAESSDVKRWFSLLMLVGALLGLLGQEAALARVLPPAPKVEQVAAAVQMSPECAEMMGLTKQNPKSDQPCQGMTPECIAKMGCAAPLALLPPLASDPAPELRAMLPDVAPASPLVGRNFGPEPEPPARLG